MDNHTGMFFGQYRLVSHLSSGSFGSVYLGRHVFLNRQVAIKVLHTQLAGDKKQRFCAEARIAASLDHPHIVPIIDFGIVEDTPFIVMASVSGESLRDQLTKGERASLTDVVSSVKQLAGALQYAHNHNVIHRDIKPSNLFLAKDGKVMLADFGIAVLVDEAHRRARLFSDAQLLMVPECWEQCAAAPDARYMQDTMTYIAPEQFEGSANAASDQYSLAVIAYEWLTGKLPVLLGSPQERWVDWAQIHQKENPPVATSLDPAISPEIEQVIYKALAIRPEDRYADILTFAAALQIAAERVQEQNRFYPVTWYKQRLEEYEQGFRAEVRSGRETSLQEGKPLEVLVECLTKPYTEKALAHLSWVERNCLFLHIDAGFAPYEIAEILSIEEPSVQEHLERGQRQLLETYSSLLREEQEIAVDQEVSLSASDPILRVERLVRSSFHDPLGTELGTQLCAQAPGESYLEYDWIQAKLFRITYSSRQEVLDLYPQEHKLIRYMDHRNRANGYVPVMCTFEELQVAIWGEEHLHTDAEVIRLVWELRKKLEVDPKEPQFLQTVRGLGYRLVTRSLEPLFNDHKL